MTGSYWEVVAAGPCALVAVGSLPAAWADRRVATFRTGLSWLLAAALASSLAAGGALATRGPLDYELFAAPWGVDFGFYFDGLSALMSPLICFIGLIIVRYSARCLDGDPRQGRFLRWTSLTLGSVLFMIVARNLVMFAAAWTASSYGLHKLLTHYPDRPWAVWAARKKFLISRLGDVFLLAALALTYREFGSFDFPEIFKAVEAGGRAPDGPSLAATWIGVLFALGAMTKSAQFPFHSWLPDTLEAPTPVSALMHAGVINAGGFLVIRLSPLFSLSSAGLALLALVGAFTALFAAVVMLTQTSVKRMLAWSTIAQMGFMMLQCGLGAFSAALLHIVAHSLYKTHAFLTSGSVLDRAAGVRPVDRPTVPKIGRWAALPFALACSAAFLAGFALLLRIDLLAKPGSWVLGFVMIVALTQLIWPSLHSGSARVAGRGLAAAALICLSYLLALRAVDAALASSAPFARPLSSPAEGLVLGLAAAGFLGVLFLQAFAESPAVGSTLRSLYVHAANGFYLDAPARRLTAWVWGESSPTP